MIRVKIKQKSLGWGMAQVVECLPSKWEVPSQTTVPQKTKQKKKKTLLLVHWDDPSWKNWIRPPNMITSHNKKWKFQILSWSVPLCIISSSFCQCQIKRVKFTCSITELSCYRGTLLSLYLFRIKSLKKKTKYWRLWLCLEPS
jgi:hypothetical protein